MISKRNAWGFLLITGMVAVIISIPLLPAPTNHQVETYAAFHDSKDKLVVFFGFSACSEVCPITLSIFANTLTTHVPEVEFTNFYFIDINPETSHEETQRYAHLFHSEIKTYKPDEKTIDRFDSTFGLNINNIESIIEHNGKTFLLEKNQENNWYITKVFNPNTFTKHSLIRALR